MNALLFAFAHKLYRRAHRSYAWFVGIPDRVYITMNGTLVAGLIGLFSGPVIVFLCTALIVAIITLMKS